MSMQNRIYKAGARWDQLYNDTVVDYSIQMEAWLQRFKKGPSRGVGDTAVTNVVYLDTLPQAEMPEIIPSLEMAQES